MVRFMLEQMQLQMEKIPLRFPQKDMKTVPSPLPNKNFAEVLECANERIPRRHALATSHWQRYVSNQNTVAKYRPCSSTFSGIVHFAHCQKLLACLGSLKRNSPFRPNYKTRKNRDTVTVVNFRRCASVFFVLYTRKLMRKALVLNPVCVHWRCGRLFPASV